MQEAAVVVLLVIYFVALHKPHHGTVVTNGVSLEAVLFATMVRYPHVLNVITALKVE